MSGNHGITKKLRTGIGVGGGGGPKRRYKTKKVRGARKQDYLINQVWNDKRSLKRKQTKKERNPFRFGNDSLDPMLRRRPVHPDASKENKEEKKQIIPVNSNNSNKYVHNPNPQHPTHITFHEEIVNGQQQSSLQNNTTMIALINEVRELHQHTVQSSSLMGRAPDHIVPRNILPPNSSNFSFDPWHVDGTPLLHGKTGWSNVMSMSKIINKEEYQQFMDEVIKRMNVFDHKHRVGCMTSSKKKLRLCGEKMHVLCDLLEEKHLSGMWMEKHVELHYLNFGGLEGILYDHWASGTKYGPCSGKL